MTMNNIISTEYAGKRRHGETPWFWAVWIDVDRVQTWNQTEPVASGYCPSKTTARRAAWAALKEKVPDPSNQRAYYTTWAYWYLSSLREQDRRPSFSRCSIGKNRWQWVVYRDLCDEEPLAAGIAESADAARNDAEQRIGSVRDTENWAAKAYRTKCLALERSRKTASSRNTSSIEFVYRCYMDYSDYDGRSYDVIEKHRIVKRTKKRIFVDREEFRDGEKLNGDWHDFVRHTFALDRHELETCGMARRRSKGWWDHQTYYADPAIYFAHKPSPPRPECFVVLDVPAGATGVEVAAAYRRLASKTHPDVGGDAEEFKRICQAYEQAMAIVFERTTVA